MWWGSRFQFDFSANYHFPWFHFEHSPFSLSWRNSSIFHDSLLTSTFLSFDIHSPKLVLDGSWRGWNERGGSGKVSAWWSRSEIGWYKAVGSTLCLLNFGTAVVMFKSTRLPFDGEKHTNRKADLQTDNWNKLWADTEIKYIKIHWQTRKWHWNR